MTQPPAPPPYPPGNPPGGATPPPPAGPPTGPPAPPPRPPAGRPPGGPPPKPRRGRAVAVAAVVVVLAVVAGVLVVVLRDDDAEPAAGIRAADVLTERQLALVRKAVPDPKCDAGAGQPAGNPSSVPLDVMRVEGTCLKVTTEYLPADRVAARRAELAQDPSVVESAVAPPTTTDATPLLPAVEDHRDDQWPLDILGVPKGADRVPWPDGTGAVVAVLDTGIDAAHPDLAGAVIARRDYPGQGVPDPGGHGTHVAGIVAGRSGNGGITGVAPAVSLLDVPIRLKDANASGPSWFVGLPWAVNHGADAVNMSFGSSYAAYSKPEYQGALAFGAAVVEFAHNSQVVLVASGGNCGGGPTTRDSGCEARDQRQLPSVYDDVVTVGAIAPDRDLSAFSTRNDDIDLVAPGGDHGNRPPNMFTGDEVLSAKPGGGFTRMQGTSQAAPHVAAAAAVARSLRPDATADEIADALVGTADMNGIAKDDRGKTGSGHGLLNIPAMVDRLRNGPTASPSGPTAGPGPSGPPGAPDAAARTQAAYVHDGTLYAFDGTTSNPVRRVDPQSPLRWVAWSSDHKLLVGADGKTLFSWAGPGSATVEKPCDWCGNPRETPALVDDAVIADPLAGTPTADLVMRVSYDGTLTRYSARTLEELGSARAAFPDGDAGDKSLQGAVAGKLIVHASGGAHASERVWLVDPVSGQVGAFHDVSGSVLGGAAVSADGGKVALVTGHGTCGRPEGMYVLAGNDLREMAKPTPPPGVMVDELFFNGGTLLASMSSYTMSPGTPCVRVASAGLWQLNGTTWQRVDPSMTAGRPLEGRPGTFPTGWLTVRGTAGAVEPAAAIDLDKGDLGTVQGRVWATPTRTEVPVPPPR